MNQSLDVSTIVFAALAIFIVWKLRSVLGTRTGEERPPFNPFLRRSQRRADGAPDKETTGTVIPLPGMAPEPATAQPAEAWKGVAEPGSRLAKALEVIAAAEPSFSGRMFLDGARQAYEMILSAFAKGDRAALSGLLAKDVMAGFGSAIDDREGRKETLEHTMVSSPSCTIEDAQLSGGTAQITVRFESHQINALRAADRSLADGSTEAAGPVTDHWTFGKAIPSQDPNWTLTATSGA